MAGGGGLGPGSGPGGEIRALTGLRGVAACYVVLYHMLQDLPGSGLAGVVRHGYIAVDLFFVLSGFVLATVHGRDTFDRAGYALFLRKRFARIYPLYAAVTAVTLLGIAVTGAAPISPARFAVNVALLQAWGAGAGIVAPSWSLSAELGAYLLFPLLAALLLWGSRRQAIAGAGLALALLATISLGGPQLRSGPLDLYQAHSAAPLLRGLGGFTLGLAAFRLSRHGRAAAWLGRPGSAAILGLGLAALLAWPGSDLAIVALFGPFVAALAANRHGVGGRLLAAPLPHGLGTLSFSIYLVHFPIREWLRVPLADRLAAFDLPHASAWATGLACAVTLAVAAVTYRLIERPGRSMLGGQPRLASTLP